MCFRDVNPKSTPGGDGISWAYSSKPRSCAFLATAGQTPPATIKSRGPVPARFETRGPAPAERGWWGGRGGGDRHGRSRRRDEENHGRRCRALGVSRGGRGGTR